MRAACAAPVFFLFQSFRLPSDVGTTFNSTWVFFSLSGNIRCIFRVIFTELTSNEHCSWGVEECVNQKGGGVGKQQTTQHEREDPGIAPKPLIRRPAHWLQDFVSEGYLICLKGSSFTTLTMD